MQFLFLQHMSPIKDLLVATSLLSYLTFYCTYNCFPHIIYIANFVISVCIPSILLIYIKRCKSIIFHDVINAYKHCIHKAFYCENDLISSEYLACLLIRLTSPLAVMMALVLSSIVECRAFRLSFFKVYQICWAFLKRSVFVSMLQTVSLELRYGLFDSRSRR